MKVRVPALHNLLEPPQFLRHFLEHPPEGFSVAPLEGDVPAFSATFDLLTTLDPEVRRKVVALPLARWWRRVLFAETCFIGATVTEYVPLPGTTRPERLAHTISRLKAKYAWLIVKDIPAEGTLVGDAAIAYSREFVRACRDDGFTLVDGQALAYVPIDFASTDEYLSRASRSRRKNIRRKLRNRDDLQVEAIRTGDVRFDNEAFLVTLYALYSNVYAQSEVQFDRLTPAFFSAVLRDAALDGVIFLYRVHERLIGFNFCLCENEMLIDKYVGFAYPDARDHDLYTVSWFQNLEYALERKFSYYVAGWTDPEIKRQLGASFTFTIHAVYARNPFMRMLLRIFKRFFEADRRWQDAHV